MYESDAFKCDYGGHDSLFVNNVVSVRHYDGQSCFNTGDYVAGYESQLYGNTCVLPPDGSHGDPELVDSNLGGMACTGGGPGAPIVHDNHYFTSTGRATASCDNGTTVDVLALPPPVEARSTAGFAPSPDVLTSWFRAKLIALQQ